MKNSKLSIAGLVDNYRGLPSSIYVLFVARIINRFGGFVHAFLALFLSMYIGMGEDDIGQYVMMAGAAGLFGSMIGGRLGDKFSRKVVYLLAQGTAAFFFLPCAYLAYTGDYELIPVFLIISSFFGAVVRPVSTAMVTDIVDKEDRKRAYSLLYLGINIGVAVGPMVAAMLLNDYLVWFFLGDAITTFVAVILVGAFVHERRMTKEEMDAIPEGDGEAVEESNLLAAFLKRPKLILFVMFSIVISMVYAQTGFALPLLMKDLYGETNGPLMFAQIAMFNAVVVIVFTSFTHYVTGHIKPIYNIAMAAFLYAVGMGLLAFSGGMVLIYVSTFIWTIGEIQAVTNQNVYLMEQTPINYRSRFLATISIITSLGYIYSPNLGGRIIMAYGQATLWRVVMIAGLVATIGYMVIAWSDRHDVKEELNLPKLSQKPD